MKSVIPQQRFLRSRINRLITESIEITRREQFALPPFAFWDPNQWRCAGTEWDSLRQARMGWDVTDFGCGDFLNVGRVLFTLRNGISDGKRFDKPYAEKIIIGRQGQRAPAHFHRKKIEDVINRGGGNLSVLVAPSGPHPAQVVQDGRVIPIKSETCFCLKPGESICIAPGTIHQFWGEETLADRIPLIGEVSSVCDDIGDNVFLQKVARFIEIEEDEPARYCLCHELPEFEGTAAQESALEIA